MNVLDSVLAAIIGIIGLVIYYAFYSLYSGCIGSASGLFVVIPIAISAGIVIYILMTSFYGK